MLPLKAQDHLGTFITYVSETFRKNFREIFRTC